MFAQWRAATAGISRALAASERHPRARSNALPLNPLSEPGRSAHVVHAQGDSTVQ